MSSITFDALSEKFEFLPEQAREEALDFIEFLLKKRMNKSVKKEAENRRKLLLGMSVWDDQDMERLDEVRENLNKWQPEIF